MRVTSSRDRPGRTTKSNVTGTTCSPTTSSGSPWASAPSVALTPPSTEFSIGTIAASTSPARTASSAASTLATGTSSAWSPPPVACRSACSVNVPSGPR
jgi:hypothetical protein